jgi:hypothetical protein
MANRVFDSMKSAAAGLGVSIEALKAAKAAGCPAFHNSRVNEDEFKQWASAQPPVSEQDAKKLPLRDQKITEEIRRLRIANDASERELIKGELAIAIIAELGAEVCGQHEKMLAQAPIAMTDDPLQNRVVLGRNVDEVRKGCREAESKCKMLLIK